MKKFVIVLFLIILFFSFIINNSYCVYFTYNDTVYTIDYDIPSFPVSYQDTVDESEYIFDSYVLFYDVNNSSVHLACLFSESDYYLRKNLKDNSMVLRFSTTESSSLTTRYLYYFIVYDLVDNSWDYNSHFVADDGGVSSDTFFYFDVDNQVILFKSDNVYFGNGFLNDGVIESDILFDLGITTDGFIFVPSIPDVPVEPGEPNSITLNDIHIILCALTFITILQVLFNFLYLSFFNKIYF